MKISGTDTGYRLFIIESPKKINMLTKILRGLGESFVIAATYGRLYDIEPIDPYEFTREGRVKWRPINEDRIDFIQTHIGGASEVVVATDSDIEGEVIAWHLQRLAEVVGTTVKRIHVKSINEKGIKDALANPCDVDLKKAEGGVARRIFDNFGQFAIDDARAKEKPFIKGSVGRIISPLIASCSDRSLHPTTIKKSFNASDVDVIARVPAGIDADSVESKIRTLPRPALEQAKITERAIEPLNLSDAVQLLSSSMKRSPSDTFNDLKNLFDKGRISYFRSDSRRLSGDTLDRMHQQINDYTSVRKGDISSFRSDDLAQDAHEGIVPLVINGNPFSPVNNLDPEEATLSLLWRYYSLVISAAKVTTVTKELSGFAAESSGWRGLASRGVNLEFSRSIIRTPSGQDKVWDPEFTPMGIPASKALDERTLRRDYSSEELAFNRLVELGIGRPSTISMHAAKYGSRFVSGGRVNGRGEAALTEAQSTAPGLLDRDMARKIESDLHEPSDTNTITDKVVEALNDSGWLKRGSKAISPDPDRTRGRRFTQSFDA